MCSYVKPLQKYLSSGKPYFGICLGMQTLFASSSESSSTPGLGVIPSAVTLFPMKNMAVPHMGWNGVNVRKSNALIAPETQERYYFVHSFLALPSKEMNDWICTTTDYGVEFVSSVQKGNIFATQFHPEKSGKAGLDLLRRFLSIESLVTAPTLSGTIVDNPAATQLAPRVIACLDVRANDAGDLVVTKGDQ